MDPILDIFDSADLARANTRILNWILTDLSSSSESDDESLPDLVSDSESNYGELLLPIFSPPSGSPLDLPLGGNYRPSIWRGHLQQLGWHHVCPKPSPYRKQQRPKIKWRLMFRINLLVVGTRNN